MRRRKRACELSSTTGYTGIPGIPGIPGIHAIQHYLVRASWRLQGARSGLSGHNTPASPALSVTLVPVYSGYSRIPVYPCVPGQARELYLWSFLIALWEPLVPFGQKSQAPFGQKSTVLLAKSSLKHRVLSAKSRLLFWPKAGFFLGQKPASLLAKDGPTGLCRVRYGPTGLCRVRYGPTGLSRVRYGPTGLSRVRYGPTGLNRVRYGPTGLIE